MTVSIKISKKEIEILQSMIGKTFEKFKCDPFIFSPMVYGLVGFYVDGKIYKFGYEEKYGCFWRSGGGCGFEDQVNWESYVNYGEWVINVEKLPEELKKYALEIDKVFNENVEQGCCGGCL